MSDQRPPAVYAPLVGSKKRTTTFGDVVRLGFKAEEFAEWLRANANDKGYVNLNLTPRRNKSEANEYTLTLDTWKPDGQRREASKATEQELPPREKDDSDSVRF